MPRKRGGPKTGPAHAHGLPAGRSQRQLRVGEVIRHKLAEIFARGDLHEDAVAGIPLTVSEVRLSPDMRHATVFVSRLGGGEMKDVLAGLTRARGYLRHEVGRDLTSKFTPDLTFIEDKSFDEAGHILGILRRDPVVAQDVEKDGGPPPPLAGEVSPEATEGSSGGDIPPSALQATSPVHGGRKGDDKEDDSDGQA